MSGSQDELGAKGRQVLRGFYQGEAAEEMGRRGREVIDGVASGRFTRSGQFAHGVSNDWIGDIAKDPRLLELVSSHLGEDVCLFSWRVLMKDHHFNGEVLIHQDWPYYGGGGLDKLNVFVPLTRVHRGNGALVFFEESHHFGPVERGAIDAGQFPDLVESCPELEVGDILLAHFLTWHYSAPATVAEDRILLQIIFQPADDASSKNLVAGQIRNKRWLPDRWDAMRIPVSYLSCATAKMYLDAGDMVRAERFAQGVLSSDPQNPDAALILYDVFKAREDPAAGHWLEVARAGLARMTGDLEARSPAAAPEAPPEPPVSAPEQADEPAAQAAAPPPWTAGRVLRGVARRLGAR